MIGTNPEFDTFRTESVPANPEPFRLINRIPIRESHEPLVDLRLQNPDLLLSEKCVPYVRKTVSEMLHKAAAALPPGHKLRVGTALRTLEMQSENYWKNYKKLQEEHPTWPVNTLRRQCNRFYAPPDAKAPPGHCTGAAVDVHLCLDDGTGLDHSSPLEGWQAAPTAVPGLSAEAAETRRLLCYVMHSAGFSNCRDEYWHWSYGDSAWAVRMGAEEPPYGYIEP